MGRIATTLIKDKEEYYAANHKLPPVNVIPDEGPDDLLICPEYLSQYARVFYNKHARRLLDAKILHNSSWNAFCVLATSWAIWRGLIDLLHKLEEMAVEKGLPPEFGWLTTTNQVNPIIKRIEDAAREYRLHAQTFGFNPSSQGNVSNSLAGSDTVGLGEFMDGY